MGSSVTTRRKSWEKSPNFGVISEIQRAKFGVFVTCIFGGKIWGSNKNFRGKFWGQARRPPNMEVPPGFQYELLLRILPTNRLLRLMKIRQSDLCSFCDKETETISHLFRECESALRFWNSLSLLVLETNVLRIDFKQRNILLGILKGLLSVNYFILLGKYYIYKCKWLGIIPKIRGFIQCLKFRHDIKKCMAWLGTNKRYKNTWTTLKPIMLSWLCTCRMG